MTIRVVGSPRHLASVLNRSSLWYVKREPYNMMKFVSRTQNGNSVRDIQAVAAHFGVRVYRNMDYQEVSVAGSKRLLKLAPLIPYLTGATKAKAMLICMGAEMKETQKQTMPLLYEEFQKRFNHKKKESTRQSNPREARREEMTRRLLALHHTS